MKHKRIVPCAMKGKDGTVYYSCEYFFGIQNSKGDQMISGHILEDESIPECWEEIAQQLYAIKEGWAEL